MGSSSRLLDLAGEGSLQELHTLNDLMKQKINEVYTGICMEAAPSRI